MSLSNRIDYTHIQWRLLVTPVVMFLEDPSIVANLSLSVEVDRIFSHPLEAILDPSLAEDEILSRKGTEDWPYEEELYVSNVSNSQIIAFLSKSQNNSDSVWTQMRSSVYRMHRFRSSASTIKGLTADILASVLPRPLLGWKLIIQSDLSCGNRV